MTRSLLALLLSASLLLSACNTVDGIGQDMTQAGRALSQAASK